MGIFARLCLLVGIALLPIAAVQLSDELDRRQAREREPRIDALRLARIVALEQGRIFEGARQLLTTVVQIRPLALQSRDLCGAALARLAAHTPQYAYIATIDLQGNLLCASSPKLRREDVAADRPFIVGAVTSGDFAVGGAALQTGGPGVLPLGFPISGESGNIAEIAVAGLRLDRLADDLATIALPAGASLTVADRNGVVIAHLPRDDQAPYRIGDLLPEDRRALAHGTSPGSLEARDAGVVRVFGFAPLEAPPARGVYVEVALDASAASTALGADTARRGLASGGAVVLGFLLAVVGAQFLIRRPTGALVRAARRWREGDWAARIGPGHRTSEFDRLGHAFDEMAEALSRRERDLVEAKEKAEAASRAKSSFLAAMSNELRAPLYAIVDFSEAMGGETAGTDARERDRESATYIHASAQHLLRLVNDMVDLAKLAAGQMELAESLVEVDALLRESIDLLRAQMEQNSVSVRADIAHDLPPLLAGEKRLRQAFANLLSNAVKFSRQGGTVTITARRLAPSGDIAVVIADQGIGMQPQEIATALDPFGRAEPALSRYYDGAGLGLPLAKMLVEKHGGTLILDSAPGEGTTVTVTLPAARLRPRTKAPQPTQV
jgi:signal transduction histidine kinase